MYYKQQIIRRNNEYVYREFELQEVLPKHVSEARLKESIFFEKNQRHVYRGELNKTKLTSDKAILVVSVNSWEELEGQKKRLFEEFEMFLKKNTKNKEEMLKEAKMQEEKFRFWKGLHS
jgi:predicted RNA methylase